MTPSAMEGAGRPHATNNGPLGEEAAYAAGATLSLRRRGERGARHMVALAPPVGRMRDVAQAHGRRLFQDGEARALQTRLRLDALASADDWRG
jgi:hypothetical protein